MNLHHWCCRIVWLWQAQVKPPPWAGTCLVRCPWSLYMPNVAESTGWQLSCASHGWSALVSRSGVGFLQVKWTHHIWSQKAAHRFSYHMAWVTGSLSVFSPEGNEKKNFFLVFWGFPILGGWLWTATVCDIKEGPEFWFLHPGNRGNSYEDKLEQHSIATQLEDIPASNPKLVTINTCSWVYLQIQESFNNPWSWQKNHSVVATAWLLPPCRSPTSKRHSTQPPSSCSGVAFLVVVLGIIHARAATDSSAGTDVLKEGLPFWEQFGLSG